MYARSAMSPVSRFESPVVAKTAQRGEVAPPRVALVAASLEILGGAGGEGAQYIECSECLGEELIHHSL